MIAASAPAATAMIIEVLLNEVLCQIFEHLTVTWQIVCHSVCQRSGTTSCWPGGGWWWWYPTRIRFCFAREAAGEGHLEVLKWARSQGCPWVEETCASRRCCKCCNGWEAKAVPGMDGHVPMLLVEAIWKCWNGPEDKAVPGMSGHGPGQPMEAIWRCCSEPEAKAVPGMRHSMCQCSRRRCCKQTLLVERRRQQLPKVLFAALKVVFVVNFRHF